jgi:hypothetical protein
MQQSTKPMACFMPNHLAETSLCQARALALEEGAEFTTKTQSHKEGGMEPEG